VFERELLLYDFMFGYAQLLTGDVADESMADQPFTGANHPAWILGHLRVSEDAALRLLDVESDCPSQWYDLFEPGTEPQPDRQSYPSKNELLVGLKKGHRQLVAAVRNVAAEDAARPNPVDVLQPWLATFGDVLAHVLATHPAIHCGQLAAWRRGMGLPIVAPTPKLR